MADTSLGDLHEAVRAVDSEIRTGGSEFDFRYSLLDHLFTDALGWSRTEGSGHVTFEDDRKDVLCYDDSDPPFPVIVCETKRPSHELDLSDVDQLETYMTGVGSADYGVLTNGRTFRIYEYDLEDRSISALDGFDVGSVADADAVEDLDETERDALDTLRRFSREQFTGVGSQEYFRTRAREVPVRHRPGTDDEGYELFLDAVTQSLEDLTGVMQRFFDDYRDRAEESYPRQFLDTTFPDWKEWRKYTGKSDDAAATFCRETAYILLNRVLFARIAEDKEIVDHTRLSGRGMAAALTRGDDRPYLAALIDTYDRIDDHYGDLYELGIFDWWWVSRDKRQQFDTSETRRQETLEDELDARLGEVFERLNRFDFEYVNRDILGHVYEDYLPREERKELGEYYTPIEVVRYMLDDVGYVPSASIGRETILDPACGSGGFLTEATERLIQHFLRKFGRESVHYLDAEEARTILERIEANVYGIDINPFAVHITQINLLFRTVDLYDTVTEQDPSYTMDGFEIHVADTLAPTALEEQRAETDQNGQQSQIAEFAQYNGRAQSFLDDRDAVEYLKDELAFDVVVANPPYVRTQNITGPKGDYVAQYDTVDGRSFDIYVPFVERGLDWLTDDGRLAYICPNRLLTHEYATGLRDRLGREPLTRLVDFGDVSVFDAATPYPCLFTVDRRADADTDVECARIAAERADVLEELYRRDEWETPSGVEAYDLFTYPRELLRADNEDENLRSWKPMPDDERRAFEAIRDAAEIRLERAAAEVFVGIQTSANRVFTGFVEGEHAGRLVDTADSREDSTRDTPDDSGELVQFRAKGDETAQPVERGILRRLLRGPEVDRWGVDWEGLWLVFPYEVTDGEATVLSEQRLREEYEHAWQFFSDHEADLRDRHVQADEWWAFGRRQNVDKMEPEKIVTNIMSARSRFVADTEGTYYFLGGGNAGGYGIQLREEYAATEADYLYYVALLNSSVLEFYHKQIAPIFGGKYYSYNKRYLQPHPIVPPTAAPDETVVEYAEQISEIRAEQTELVRETDDVRNYLSAFDCSWTVVDLARSVRLDDDDYRQDPIRRDSTTVAASSHDEAAATTETVYRVVMKRGHELTFDDERVRDFVFELLTATDERLTRADVLDTETPSRDDVIRLMETYRADEDRITELDAEFERLCAELDEIVLETVYGLDESARETVTEFLQTW